MYSFTVNKKHHMKNILFLCLVITLGIESVKAQRKPRPSQKATVSQFIANDHEIRIEYNRPVARGRVLFGEEGIIKYDKVWMPGANEATNISFDQDVIINGEFLEEGRYSMWTIPGENEWEIIFSKDWDQWHTRYPGEEEDALRLFITPQEGSHMEVLAYYFSLVTDSSTTLNLHWGTLIIPIKIELSEEG